MLRYCCRLTISFRSVNYRLLATTLQLFAKISLPFPKPHDEIPPFYLLSYQKVQESEEILSFESEVQDKVGPLLGECSCFNLISLLQFIFLPVLVLFC